MYTYIQIYQIWVGIYLQENRDPWGEKEKKNEKKKRKENERKKKGKNTIVTNNTKPTPKLPTLYGNLNKFYVSARAPKYTGEACMTQSNCTALTHRANGLVV